MITRLSSLLALVLLLLAPPLYAQDGECEDKGMTEEASERFRAQLQETGERLQLTDEQKEAVCPILKDAYVQRQAVLEEYGIDLERTDRDDRPGRRTLRRMRNDLKEVNEKTKEKLAVALTDDQMDLWDELQEERHAEMRDRIRNGS
jgi:hypothetical protein